MTERMGEAARNAMADQRTQVEKAVGAFFALDPQEKIAFAARVNEIYKRQVMGFSEDRKGDDK